MKLRSLLFWLHLVAGIVAGVIILVMSITGAAIAFEKEIVAWAERDVRTVGIPEDSTKRLTLDEMLERVRRAHLDDRPSSVVVSADAGAAVQFAFGRTNAVYVNPYTGTVQAQGAAGVRRFMRFMTDWHRWLGQDGDGRAVGKAITGACNAAFLFLALSGLVLWWPRKWSWSSVKGALCFNWKLSGKARDWNWHNVIGIWTAPVLVVLTASGMVISYRWASDLVYRLAGEPPPQTAPRSAPSGGRGSSDAVEAGVPLGNDALLASVQSATPKWEQITLRLGGGGPSRGTPGERPGTAGGNESTIAIAVREAGAWPLFGADQYTLNAITGAVVKKETFGDYSAGRQTRMWLRFLHTGEALGKPGKFVAAVASLGGAILVWTGFALALRRFVGWRRNSALTGTAPVPAENVK